MRLNYVLIGALFLGATSLVACKKSANDAGNNSIPLAVDYYIESSPLGTDTFTFAYDSDGKVVSLNSKVNPGSKFAYSYPGTNKFFTDIYNNNKVSIHYEMYFGNNGQPDSVFQYNETKDSSYEKYFYVNNRLDKVLSFDFSKNKGAVYNKTEYYTYTSDGYIASNYSTKGDTTTNFYYSPYKMAYYPVIGFTIPNTTPTQVNLVKYTVSKIGGSSYTVNNRYGTDALNRLIADTSFLGNSTTPYTIKRYFYK